MLHEKNHYNTYLRLTLILTIFILIVIIYFPTEAGLILKTVKYDTVQTMIRFLPAFFVLFGLIEVLLPKETVINHLGKCSGLKGNITAFLLGAIIPGPIYLAFPIATMMLHKGTSTFNTTLFISAWASFNLTEEIFELQFLGWKFLLLRFIITVPILIGVSYLMERLAKPKPMEPIHYKWDSESEN
jgi:uncharacterized membrane protein YraQ (UPF0718 family)